MLRSGVTGSERHLKRVWSSRLAVPLRPASSGPVRYWQDQVRLAVKAAIAAVGAWALARYAVGPPDPYFAPLAALLGVYPTVARSLREGETAQLPDHSDARSAARHLARLTSEMISEIAGHQAAPRHSR